MHDTVQKAEADSRNQEAENRSKSSLRFNPRPTGFLVQSHTASIILGGLINLQATIFSFVKL